jgi:hypothetical protein
LVNYINKNIIYCYMELNIKELECNEENELNYEQEPIHISFEDIPENNIQIKVNKKGVQFKEPIKPINQPIPSEYAKMVRPKIQNKKPQISYEDIIAKMGMFVANGKLHLMDNNPEGYEQIKKVYQQQYQQPLQQQQQYTNIPQNSYIYNKYFKEELQPQNEMRRPMTVNEYKRKVLENFIQRQRINQIKSRKLLIPTANINISPVNSVNVNKLFYFSKR